MNLYFGDGFESEFGFNGFGIRIRIQKIQTQWDFKPDNCTNVKDDF